MCTIKKIVTGQTCFSYVKDQSPDTVSTAATEGVATQSITYSVQLIRLIFIHFFFIHSYVL